MEPKQLVIQLDEFRLKLREHQELWVQSVDRHIPQYAIKNISLLRTQSEWLTRRLGALRPYIERYEKNWVMHHQMTGASWDALEASVGLSHVAPAKGPAMMSVLERLNMIIGTVENSAQEIVNDKAESSDVLPIEQMLHPFLCEVCLNLYKDRYYEQSKAESAKAVFEYLRQKTGSELDGSTLAENVFSTTTPKLKFGDISIETNKNLQLGMMNLLKGLAAHIRNPSAHQYGKVEEKLAAYEVLMFCSMLCKRIDAAETV
jgi:uncharacterized protein (TIGR02391 family)